MRLLFAFDFRLDRTPDGRVWWDGTLDYAFWGRYLEVFDELRIVARVRDVPTVPPSARQIDGPRVTVAALPFYVGPWQFARRYFALRRAIQAAVAQTDAVILRVPGIVTIRVAHVLQARGQPYGVEVIGDPYDMFAPGSIRNVLRPWLRWWVPHTLRRQCRHAAASLYVTRGALQKRYPPAPGTFTVGCSDVHVPDEAFAAMPRGPRPDQRTFTLAFVGALAQYHKGLDVLIRAIAQAVRTGLDLHLMVIGHGELRGEFERLAQACGVAERVRFLGQLPSGSAVREQLDRADLFVLPSRTEGLPRAVVEAMARGLPCIGSRIGGIPELLPDEDLVPAGDAAALARKLAEVLRDPQRLAAMSARNLETARQYRPALLTQHRRQFFEAVRAATAAWLHR